MSGQKILSHAIILRLTCVAWIVAKLICFRLWLADRVFPLVPPADWLLYVPGWIHTALFAMSLLLMAAIVVKPGYKQLALSLITVECCSCLLDQNRWQPWEYQYLFTLFVVLVNWSRPAYTHRLIAFIFSATYIYSGLNKFTPGFLTSVWDSWILHGYFKLPYPVIHHPALYHTGYLLGIIEVLCGVGLLFGRTIKLAGAVLIGMHLFILLLFGITGLRHNMVIWPWNVAMICYIVLLFFRSAPPVLHPRALAQGANSIVLLAWGVLPALCFVNLWDNYLSSNLYSGRQPYMIICIDDIEKMPLLKPYAGRVQGGVCEGQFEVNVNRWAYTELNVPPYPQFRVFSKIKAALLQRSPGASCTFIAYPHAIWYGTASSGIGVHL